MSLASSTSSMQLYSDIEVITEVLSGNRSIFEIIIRRYNPYLYKIGRSYGFNHQDTEDLMQETFISSYINLGKFAQRSSFKSWLIRIMLNHCFQKTQRSSYRNEHATDLSPGNRSFMIFNETTTNNNDATINKELNKVVETCLQKLPQDYRTTFTLRELTGLSVAETAELMRTSTVNVKTRLNRAKALLRKEIEKVYSPADIYEFNLVYCDSIVNKVMKQIDELPIDGCYGKTFN